MVVDDVDFRPHPQVLEFVHALYAVDRSPNTVRAYLRPIARFLTWCGADGVRWERVNLLEMARFKRHLEDTRGRGGRLPAATTVSVGLTAVCEFLRYCAAAGYIGAEVPLLLVERKWMPRAAGAGPRGEDGRVRHVRVNALRVRTVERPPETLSTGQQRALLASSTTVRDTFLLRLMLEGGLRIGELLGLRLEDVHFLPDSAALGCVYGGPHVHVTRRRDNDNGALAKSFRSRVVPVRGDLVACYRDYCFERDRIRSGDEVGDYVFVNYAGPRAGLSMTYSNGYQLIQRLGRQHRFPVSPHVLRHTAATGWVEQGVALDVVQDLLGHALASSTKVYVHPSAQRMRDAVSALGPRGSA